MARQRPTPPPPPPRPPRPAPHPVDPRRPRALAAVAAGLVLATSMTMTTIVAFDRLYLVEGLAAAVLPLAGLGLFIATSFFTPGKRSGKARRGGAWQGSARRGKARSTTR